MGKKYTWHLSDSWFGYREGPCSSSSSHLIKGMGHRPGVEHRTQLQAQPLRSMHTLSVCLCINLQCQEQSPKQQTDLSWGRGAAGGWGCSRAARFPVVLEPPWPCSEPRVPRALPHFGSHLNMRLETLLRSIFRLAEYLLTEADYEWRLIIVILTSLNKF